MPDKKTTQISNNLGRLFIVAAPSGGGKTSLVKQLIQDIDNIVVSISHTTRQKRPLENNGVDYFFVTDSEFNQMIDRGEFIEHAQVFNNLYGTSVTQINNRLDAGIDVVLDIDWQGSEQIKRLYPEAVSIFIIPPSLDVLKERLMNRGQDALEVIARRMQQAQDEMSHYHDFDYLIVNDQFTTAAMELVSIVRSERLTIARQEIRQRKLLSFLLTSQ